MKIVNLCMVAYIDGWGYQDNLLPEYEAKLGYDTVVIASANHFPNYVNEEIKEDIKSKGKDYYCNGVHVYRRNTYMTTTNLHFWSTGIYKILKKERPDIIFHHGINSSSLLICFLYKIWHPYVSICVDNHADFINQSSSKIWNFIILRCFLRGLLSPFYKRVTKFYGVTPGRCDFLQKVFNIDSEYIDLLPIGADTDKVDEIQLTKIELLDKYAFPNDAFVLIMGGKMGKDKGTYELIQAFISIKQSMPTLVLLLFGTFTDEDTKKLAEDTNGVYIMGWCDRKTTLELLKLAHIAIWPIHHTTLIEDAIASSIPIIVRKTSNTSHLVEGNGEFVIEGNQIEITTAIMRVMKNYTYYQENALKIRTKYSYRNIVRKIVNDVYLNKKKKYVP